MTAFTSTRATSVPFLIVLCLSVSIVIALMFWGFTALPALRLYRFPAFAASLPASETATHSAVFTSDLRGYVAIVYTGMARAFSAVFASHVFNLICSSPFTVHLYLVIMVQDDRSDYLSVSATLERYGRCQNLDGEWVSLVRAVKGWVMQRQVELNIDAEFVELQRVYDGMNQQPQPNAKVQYWTAHRADQLVAAYEEQHMLRYTWVVKARPDAVHLTNLWESLYTQQPLWTYLMHEDSEDIMETRGGLPSCAASTEVLRGHYSANDDSPLSTLMSRLQHLEVRPVHLPDLSAALATAGGDIRRLSSYLVGDVVFTPRADSSLVCIPDCDGWGGWNDQFAAGNRTVMSAYLRRGYLNLTRVHNFRRFHNTESMLASAMMYQGLNSSTLLDFCYFLIRPDYGPEHPSQHHTHVEAPTRCAMRIHRSGADCCSESCPHADTTRMQFNRVVRMLSNQTQGAEEQRSGMLRRLSRTMLQWSARHWSHRLAALSALLTACERVDQLTAQRAERGAVSAVPDDTYPRLMSQSQVASSIDITFLRDVGNARSAEFQSRFSQYTALVAQATVLASSIAKITDREWEPTVLNSGTWALTTLTFGNYDSPTVRCLYDRDHSRRVRPNPYHWQEFVHPAIQLSNDEGVLRDFQQHRACQGQTWLAWNISLEMEMREAASRKKRYASRGGTSGPQPAFVVMGIT